MRLFLTIYFLILGSSLYYKSLLLTILTLLVGIIILFCINPYRANKVKNLKTQIENSNSPVININKASWWEFEVLPCLTKIQAKKAVYIRKHSGKYSSKEDFYEKNSISDENIETIDKVIYL